MASILQHRRGTTSQHSTFSGAAGEFTYDTDKKAIVTHDGATVGGLPGGGFKQSTSAAVRSVEAKLREAASVVDYGADPTGASDSTSAFAAALAAHPNVFVPAGRYRINGTVTVPNGCTLFGATSTGDYYPSYPYTDGTLLFKDATSSNGPILRLSECSSIRYMQLDHQKINGGTDGIIALHPTLTTVYAVIQSIFIMGHRTTDTTGSTTCYGIKFDGSTTTARVQFFNRVMGAHITNCDVGVFLGGLANANVFTNIVSRECHVHYELKGNSSHDCLENAFSGMGCFTIVPMSPTAICFKLTQYAKHNSFTGYSTEAYGVEFSEGTTGISNNIFAGESNETASWTSQQNLRYMQPENVSNNAKFYLASKTTNDRNVTGTGASYFEQFFVSGTMPEANNNAGTFQAADADSKVIFRFNDTFTFLNFKSFGARLRVYVYGNSGSGMHVADVTFKYLVADSATPPYAAKLCVNQVFNNPSGGQITGLYFLTGKTAGIPQGIGLVCGNFGAFQVVNIRCVLEYEVFDYATDSDFFSNYVGLSSKTTAAATANDVTDAIDLLTVAETLI